MKTALLPLALFCAVTIPVAAHADTLYTVTNGQLVAPYLGTNVVGSYSGTFTLNTYFTILSGNFTTTVNGITYNNLNQIVGNNPTSGYAAFFDAAGDHLNFALFGAGSATNPTLCTVAICGSGDTLFDTAVANNGGYNFSANGGTLTGGTGSTGGTINAATTPEPSSLILLGTGALGVAGVLRRRLHRA